MRLLAYAKLLNRKIKSADIQAKNPFMDSNVSLNPFSSKFYNTLVWVEQEDDKYTKDAK